MEKPYSVIAISGFKKHGKDTLAKILEEEIGAQITHFADPMKLEVSECFGADIDLMNRDEIKDSPQTWLSLENCNNKDFVDFAPEHLRNLLGIDVDLSTPLSPRVVYQVYATEFRRKSPKFGHELYWIDKTHEHVMKDPGCIWVVSDLRFHLELDWVKKMDGLHLRVNMPGGPVPDVSTAHISETELIGVEPDVWITNIQGNKGMMTDQVYSSVLDKIGRNRHVFYGIQDKSI